MSMEDTNKGFEEEDVDPTAERHETGDDERYDFKLTGEALGDETFEGN